MSINVERAIAALDKRDALRDAECNAAWVIRKRKTIRIPARSERERVSADAMSCLHGLSYTIVCKKCRRDASEAARNLDSIKLKLSIT